MNRRLFLLPPGFVFAFASAFATDPSPALKFIPNRNQWAPDVQFSTAVPGGRMMIGGGRFSYYFLDNDRLHQLHERSHGGEPDGDAGWNVRGHAVHVTFLNANQRSEAMPFGRSREHYNYYIGNDPAKWASGVPAYQGVLYRSFYTGVDLKVYSSGRNLKYDFIVAPGADPSQITLRYEGAASLSLEQGDLIVRTPLAEVIEKSPVAYQYIGGKKVFVSCIYRLDGDRLSFSIPDGYDPCYELVIDPLLIFSTYSGSSADNWGSTATPGENGNLYSAGVTNEGAGGKYPATPGAFQSEYGGIYDVGILKYDSTGKELLYASYLGGTNSESAHSLIMHANGDLIVLGTTSSADFPVSTNAFDTGYNGGVPIGNVISYSFGSDLFVFRTNRDGTAILGSTFIGGAANDGLNPGGSPLVQNYGDELRGDVITDADGNIYISSVTSSSNFPVENGFDLVYNGGPTDAVIVKMNPDLTDMVWASFIGGNAVDASHTLKLDDAGNIFIAGGTASADFPVTPGAYKGAIGGVDGWIAKISEDGSSIVNATFTGTPAFEQIYFLDLNDDQQPYVYGQTNAGTNFPIKPEGVYHNLNSGQFLQKFSNNLSDLLVSTVFGSGRGTPDISPTAFLVNECNNIYMSGWAGDFLNQRVGGWPTNSVGLPVTSDAYQTTTSGRDFYFIVLTDDATERLYATFLGGSQSFTHVDGGTCRFDKNGIVYHAVCSGCNTDGLGPKSDFPTTAGAWSRTNNSNNCNNAAFKFDLSSLKARIQTNSLKRDMPGLQVICQPDQILFENPSTGGEIFEWDFGDGTFLVTPDTNAIPHEYKDVGQFIVKMKAIDRGTCKSVDSTETVVTVHKSLSSVQGDDDICAGEPYQLQAQGGSTYEWMTADRVVFSQLASPVVQPEDTTVYFVTIHEVSGCVKQDTVILNVVPKIIPKFEFARESDCWQRPSLQLTNLTDSLRSDDIMFFDFGDGQTGDEPEPHHDYAADGVYQVKLVASRHQCVYESAVTIPMFRISVPNIITPGITEGYNDRFTVQFGDVEGVTPRDFGFPVALTIYNRWGRVLFETKDYQYDWSAEGLASGIYYYELTVQDHTTCKSWLQVVK